MLATFQDQLDAAMERTAESRVAAASLTFVTIAGLLRALFPTHIEERRRGALVSPRTRRYPMEPLTDVRYVLRSLRKRPGFAAVTILTLALGIGANTAVFSVLNSVILAPLPYDEPHELVRLYTAYRGEPGYGGFSTAPDLIEVRSEVDALSSVGIFFTYRDVGLDLTTDGPPQRVRTLRVNAEYFETYRATPLMGRAFRRNEERPDVLRVVLSHHVWDTVTGRDPDIVGKDLKLSGRGYEVIGVMRPSFVDVVAGDVDLWIPEDLDLDSGQNHRTNHYLTAVGRLAPGTSIEQAQAQVDAVMGRLEAEYEQNENRIVRVEPLHADVVGRSATLVYVLMGAAGLVLLIACLNVANVFLARSIAQAKETAIRTALGAGRQRVMRQQLTESVLVAATGGLVGSIAAFWGVQLLLSISPDSLSRAEAVGLDTGLLAFAVVITVVTGLVFGAAPAYRASRADPSDALHEGSRGNSEGRSSHRVRTVLVATQVSVALVLLIAAGILMKSFARLQRVDLGFDAGNVATFEVHLPSSRYGEAGARVDLHRQFQDRVAALAGVRSVGATSWLPANGAYHEWGYDYDDDSGERRWIPAMVRVIDGDYFETMRVPLLQGRTFTRLDRASTERVAVISESLAKTVHGERDPLGHVFRVGGDAHKIIGVVGDVAHEADGRRFHRIYVSHGQSADERNWGLTYVARTSMDPAQLFGAARAELATIDPSLVLYRPRTMEAVIARHLARAQFALLLMTVFAGVALALAAVGVYGVLSYSVSQRRHEFGVRLALGARPAQVCAAVLGQAIRVTGIGMAIGLFGAFVLGRLLDSLVFEVSTRDPSVFIGVAVVLAAAVLLAGWVPARRATRVDPLDALRSE